MRSLSFTFILALLCGFTTAQESASRKPKNDAFLLEKTSPEQAIKILGKPQLDETKRLGILFVGEWVDEKFKKKEARVLSFFPFEDLVKIKLSFFDERLMAINFIVDKDIYAVQLANIYKIQFVPVFNDFGMKTSISEFEKRSKNVSVADFPRVHHLVGTNESSVLTARIFSGRELAADIRRENTGSQNEIRMKPMTGKVTDIQILSRTILK
jgi:hypothetical protein